MIRWAAPAGILLLWVLPLVMGLVVFLGEALSAEAWTALLTHPQFAKAMALSLWTGTASLVLALSLSLVLAAGFYGSAVWNRLQTAGAASLALPHLAFGIGFGFLIMPAGVLARLFVGGSEPPQWVSVQDPSGLSLIAVLALKEMPFLLVMIANVLARGDMTRQLHDQCRIARSLGHAPGSIFLRIVAPQVLRRLFWPILITWIYGATVTDLSLIIGPTHPPTAAVLIWTDLNDADPAMAGRGHAATLALTLVLALAVLIAFMLFRVVARAMRSFLTVGPSLLQVPRRSAVTFVLAAIFIYAAVCFVLLLLSLSSRWPYPELLPAFEGSGAWAHLLQDGRALISSVTLAFASAVIALLLVLGWFESQPARRDHLLWLPILLALALPQLATAAGQYRLFLMTGLTGTWVGVLLAHLTSVIAYVLVVLHGPYRGFDQRYSAVARSLGSRSWQRWREIKAPLLKAPILAAGAVGFAVSMVQFVPSQLLAAGRFSTLPMEAVTLSAGGNRALTAAYALALALAPAIVFALANLWGRPRWR